MVRVYWMNINTDGCLITQINLPFTIEIILVLVFSFDLAPYLMWNVGKYKSKFLNHEFQR